MLTPTTSPQTSPTLDSHPQTDPGTDRMAASLDALASWRLALAAQVAQFGRLLQAHDLLDETDIAVLATLRERLDSEKLVLAFVAEFSRGKSELINAIFFADYGQRILPSSAGRTTMCPTELLYDETIPPCIRLLPIETRSEAQSTTDYKGQHPQPHRRRARCPALLHLPHRPQPVS